MVTFIKGCLVEKLPSYGILTPPHLTTSLTSHHITHITHISHHSHHSHHTPHVTTSLTSHTLTSHRTSLTSHKTHISFFVPGATFFGDVAVSLLVAGVSFGDVGVVFFVAGAAFGDVGASFFVAGAAFGEIWIDSRRAKRCIFPYKMRAKARKVTSANGQVRDDQFGFGFMVESPAMVNDASYDLCHTSYYDFSWQLQYLVMFENHFSWQAQYARRSIW